jgi:hypothetical protein
MRKWLCRPKLKPIFGTLKNKRKNESSLNKAEIWLRVGLRVQLAVKCKVTDSKKVLKRAMYI